MGFITALAGFLFACLAGGLLGGGLFLSPFFPMFNFILNNGLYVLLLAIIWLFCFAVSAIATVMFAREIKDASSVGEAVGESAVIVLVGMIPQLISWVLIYFLTPRPFDDLGIGSLNNKSLLSMFIGTVIFALVVALFRIAGLKLHQYSEKMKKQHPVPGSVAARRNVPVVKTTPSTNTGQRPTDRSDLSR